MIRHVELICEVVEFILRRFKQNCDWTSQNCYWLCKILTLRFPELIIYYEPVEGHFYAGTEDKEVFFDWRGAHINLIEKPIKFDNIERHDPLWHSRLIRDCVN